MSLASTVVRVAFWTLLPSAALSVEPVLKYFQCEPRVLRAEDTTPVTVRAIIENNPTRVEVVLLDGRVQAMMAGAPDTYSTTIGGDLARANYEPGEGHNHVGFIDAYSGANRVLRLNLVLNIRDATMPDVQIQSLGAREQRSRHVVNFRDDTLYFLTGNYFDAVQRFYQLLPDDFDFIGLVSQADVPANRAYIGLRNNTRGIGLPEQDFGAVAGSASRLQGLIRFPILGFFDLAEPGSSHEIGHRWCCYSNLPALATGKPHWPVGDPAYGIMGFNIPGGTVGGNFPFRIHAQSDGTYRLEQIEPATEFNDFELYLMGLAAPSEVSPVRIFLNQAITGTVLPGPVVTTSISDVIAFEGVRTPAFGASQTDFRYAVLALSSGRLMDGNEMAFYDYMAAKGESRYQRFARLGVGPRSKVKPFYLATRGRATLSTTVCPACAVFPLFSDVQATHPFYDFITLLRQNGITRGCSPTQYCPGAATSRGQMAVFIIRSVVGQDTFPHTTSPYFNDVPANHPFFRYIQKLRDLGITAGCSATTYCPDDPVTRGQMAVFLMRGKLGSGSFPFPSTPYFSDVPPSHPFFPFIQKMRELGITQGCSLSEYCPEDATTRGQMAVFLNKSFF